MRFAYVVAVFAVAAAAAAGQSRKGKDDELITRLNQEGRFKIAFPGKSSDRDPVRVPTPAGDLIVWTSSKTVSRDLTLSVTWTDYPESFKAVPADKLLVAVAGGMKPKDAELVFDKEVAESDPNPAGREVVIDTKKHRVRARVYLVGTRLYQVAATGKEDDVDGPLARKFLASFEVVKPEAVRPSEPRRR